MSDKPTGEWTTFQVSAFLRCDDGLEVLTNAINAALAAEREKGGYASEQSEVLKQVYEGAKGNRGLCETCDSICSTVDNWLAGGTIGKELGLRLGDSVHDKILPAIQQLRTEMSEILDQLKTEQRNSVIRTDEIRKLREQVQTLMDALVRIAHGGLSREEMMAVATEARTKVKEGK